MTGWSQSAASALLPRPAKVYACGGTTLLAQAR